MAQEKNDGLISGLTRTDRKDAVRRSAPKAAIVYEAIRMEGEEDLIRKTSALIWSGVAAGLSMGFSFLMEGFLASGLPDAPWQKLITKFGYSIGFLIVVLGRQQLFTENTITPILELLHRKEASTLLRVLRLWGIVLGANIAGAFFFAFILAKSTLLSPDMRTILGETSLHSFDYSFGHTILSGIFAGWLIALMVWLLPFAESARVMVIIITTYMVGLGGFSHIIAGSVNAFYALISDENVHMNMYWIKFFIPSLLGNIIGGVTFVSAINYGQVRPHDDDLDVPDTGVDK